LANPTVSNSVTTRRSTITYTPSGGATQAPNVSTNATLPNSLQKAATLLGCDAIPFSYTLTGSVQTFTLGFPSLVQRNNLNNPINPTQATGTTLTISPGQMGVLLTLVQSMTPGITIAVEGQAVDPNAIVYPGPFIGPGTYQKLQVVLTLPAGSGAVTGWVVGLLTLSLG
jgi:hypothetical protein